MTKSITTKGKKEYSDFESFSKEQAYWERNQLVAALSKIFPAWLGWHKDKDWDDEWRNIVYIKIPVFKAIPEYVENIQFMQVSWHIHEDDKAYFSHLDPGLEEWDGHDTNDKYRRLRCIKPKYQGAK